MVITCINKDCICCEYYFDSDDKNCFICQKSAYWLCIDCGFLFQKGLSKEQHVKSCKMNRIKNDGKRLFRKENGKTIMVYFSDKSNFENLSDQIVTTLVTKIDYKRTSLVKDYFQDGEFYQTLKQLEEQKAIKSHYVKLNSKSMINFDYPFNLELLERLFEKISNFDNDIFFLKENCGFILETKYLFSDMNDFSIALKMISQCCDIPLEKLQLLDNNEEFSEFLWYKDFNCYSIKKLFRIKNDHYYYFLTIQQCRLVFGISYYFTPSYIIEKYHKTLVNVTSNICLNLLLQYPSIQKLHQKNILFKIPL